MARFLNI